MPELGALLAYPAQEGIEITFLHQQIAGPKLTPDELPAQTLDKIRRLYAPDDDTFGAWCDGRRPGFSASGRFPKG